MVVSAPALPPIIHTVSIRFSGHESFPLRFGWLPKAYALTTKAPDAWRDSGRAMVGLGLGKNMVVSLRFWADALAILREANGRMGVTKFGEALLNTRSGWDPYLERRETLWALHWRLAHARGGSLFAWTVLFGHWVEREWTRSEILDEFARLAVVEAKRTISPVTLAQHFDAFVRTYLPASARRGRNGEDDLDCPLAELRLVEQVGERRVGRNARVEAVYSLRYGAKPELDDRIFFAALAEYWFKHRRRDQTLAFRDVASSPLGPGRVFCLSEDDLRDRLERASSVTSGALEFRSSGLVDALHRKARIDPGKWWRDALSPPDGGRNN